MTPRLALWAALAAAGWIYAFWVYRTRELPVPRRNLLATLRGGAVALVLLLLLDLPLPGGARSGGAWQLVDVSSSMGALENPNDGATGVAAGDPTGPEAPGRGDGDSGRLRTIAFGAPGDSRLAPALTRALEGGATRVQVTTDLRLQDPVAVEALLRRAPVPVEIRDVGTTVRNAGVAALEIPDAVRAGESVEGTATIFGNPGDTLTFGLSWAAEVADTTVVLPAGGRVRLPIRLPAPDAGGEVAVTGRVRLAGDVFPADDRRSRVLAVDPPFGELVLVSWTPDWEPRFLLPTLEDVTGLRSQGWLRIGPDRFLSMHGPREVVTGRQVLRRLAEARVAVLHAPSNSVGDGGSGTALDSAVARVVGRHPRVLTIPGSVGSGGASGEWFVASELPPSPLAGELSGIPLVGLPPLSGVREPAGTPAAALLLQRGGRGEAVPGILLREVRQGRRVEVLAHGFWRWHMREGAGREFYRRLWSGAAGWLLAERAGSERSVGMAPLVRVVAPGAPLGWRAGPAAGGSVEVEFTPAEGAGAGEGGVALPEASTVTLTVDSLGRAQGAAPGTPGVFRWDARVAEGPDPELSATGLLVVEPGDLDLLPPRAVSLSDMAPAQAAGLSPTTGRPLRTHPLPYLLLLGLLSTEWLLRRRSGLR